MKLVLAFGVLAFAACSTSDYRFYEVTETPTEQCEIRPNGEFCDPAALPAPTVETWTIERADDIVRVYLAEQVWVANKKKDGDDPNLVSASKIEVSTVAPGDCTTTTTRDLAVTADGQTINGNIHSKVRIVGDAACGDTPTGTRSTASIAGTITGAP